MRSICCLFILLLPFVSYAQKSRKGREQKATITSNDSLLSWAERAVHRGELPLADSLYSIVLTFPYDREIGYSRAQVRLAMGDTAGYCADLSRSTKDENGRRDSDRRAQCLLRDSLPYAASGLGVGLWPRPATVVRERWREDEWSFLNLYDRNDSLMLVLRVEGTDTVFVTADAPPEYEAGEGAFFKDLGSTVKYPLTCADAGISGMVYISLVISTEGRIGRLRVLRGVHPDLDAEALRAIASLPGRWRPAMYQGRAVPFAFNLPVRFTLR